MKLKLSMGNQIISPIRLQSAAKTSGKMTRCLSDNNCVCQVIDNITTMVSLIVILQYLLL